MADLYAVIGNPISHSKSPLIHTTFAQQLRQSIRYDRIEAPLDGFVLTLSEFYKKGGLGANVTVPFKQDAFNLAHFRSARATVARAANTLWFSGTGANVAIHADNTDGIGLVRDLRDNNGVQLSGKRILVLGAGGAARGVMGALWDEHPAELAISNRTRSNADALVNDIGVAIGADCIKVIAPAGSAEHRFDVVINATSASLNGELPAMPQDCFATHAVAYDMMYGKTLSPFLMHAAAFDAKTIDGIGMLVEQAAEAFFIWRGARPDTASVIAAMKPLISLA
jgi:shikimate dehydrogenase